MTDSVAGSSPVVPRHDVCVVGSFMADLVVRAPRRPHSGETIIGSSCDTYLGGKGFNQAIAAARAGARTAMVGALGDDEFGHQFEDLLAQEGIDASGVLRVTEIGTGIAFPVVENSGENSIIVVPRANHALTVADVDRVWAAIGSARVVLLQLEIPPDVVVAAAAAAHRAGATVGLNPAPAVVDATRFAGLVDIVVPNASELASLSGVDGDDPRAGAELLASATGAGAIVVTLGSRGAMVWTADGVTSVPSHAVATIDTVGAGDAFSGVLAAELASGTSLTDAVRRANAAGAIATTRAGSAPSMPTRGDVDRLMTGGIPRAVPT